jgi:hypothetical protein
MSFQFSFKLTDKPGSLAKVAETLGKAGVNIDGIAGLSAMGHGWVNLVTSDSDEAERALNESGIAFEKNEVIFISLDDTPGQIGKFAKALVKESINIDSFYLTMNGEQVISTDNLDRTRELAEELEILVEP